MDRVLALHAGSRGFDSHRGHMSERFFRSNRPGYPHPVSSELENSGIRVAVSDCSVTERRRWPTRWRTPYQTGKLCMCTQTTTNTTRTDARRRVCAAMVSYRRATRGTSLRELEYTHTHEQAFHRRGLCVRTGPLYKWWQRWDDVNYRTGVLTHGFSRPSFGTKILGGQKVM